MFEYRRLLFEDLNSYDPYDAWKTKIGLKVKSLYYRNNPLGVVPAILISGWDLFINNKLRLGYQKQEYPMVRAIAAKTLLNIYEVTGEEYCLDIAKQHLDWLIKNYTRGYSGFCWGANMPWASKNGVYSANTPFITNTPYILEGLIQYQKITNTNTYQNSIISVFDFIDKDLYRHLDEVDILSLSYSPIAEPRTVINANSYALYSLSMLLSFLPEKSKMIETNILRLYKFITTNQNKDGSWWYYADNKKGNFIDCFHTCFVLKNLIKASNYFYLPGLNDIVDNGYTYLLNNFYEQKSGLCKRFSKTDKFNLVKFDLYDNAEMLNLAYLKSDLTLYRSLKESIKQHFTKNDDIFSVIDIFNCKRNRNMLRWAVMPYIYALSHSLDCRAAVDGLSARKYEQKNTI